MCSASHFTKTNSNRTNTLKRMRNFVLLFLSFISLNAANANESIVRVSNGLSQSSAYAGGSFLVKIRIERRNLDSFFQI